MSISIPGADYTPQLTGYTGQGAFRFWCQKVLPIVYDDSLSYYELLNKVVNYLNNVIADVATVEENVDSLNKSYNSLQAYVNEHMQEIVDVVNEYTEFTTNYFNNLDVQEEINAKLDVMASDGSLSQLIGPIVVATAPDIITQWLNDHITPTTPIVDNTLTVSGAAADAKVTGEKISDLNTGLSGLETIRPKLLDNISQYNTSFPSGSFIVSDRIIEAGSYIKGVYFYATASSVTGYIYIVDSSTNIVLYSKKFGVVSGWNYVETNYYTEQQCFIGFYGIPSKYRAEYTNEVTFEENQLFSIGLRQATPLGADIGDTLTINVTQETVSYAYPVRWFVFSSGPSALSAKNDREEYNTAITEINETLSEIPPHRYPNLYDDLSSYNTQGASNAFFVSDVIINAGSYVKTIKFYAFNTSVRVYLYFISNADHYVKNMIIFPNAKIGWNYVDINMYFDTDVVVGIYGNITKYRAATPESGLVDQNCIFSSGLWEPSPKRVYGIGEEMTLTHYSTNIVVALPIQWEYNDDELTVFDDRESHKIYPHNGIVCVIDDDTGQYVPDIWEPIIQQTGIRMGFACVAGYISGEVTNPQTEYIPMSLDELRALYNNGHEIYSHSWTHPPFYDTSVTPAYIAEQCWKSRNWLMSNGFGRSADIIVYPGGLGIGWKTKQSVVSQFYKYGVDTMYVDGINPEPLNKYCIFRFNGDTATLDEIKSYIDRAVAEKKILVFMCHAYQLNLDKEANITKLVTAINYAIDSGAEVMPLSEALHRVYGW